MAIVPYTEDSQSSKMLLLALLALLGVTVPAHGEFIVAHAPDYLKFSDSESIGAISTRDIPKLITSAFGYSVSKDFKWNGLKQSSMFRRPKASVLVSVEGQGRHEPLNIQNVARYSSKDDGEPVNTQEVVNNIQALATDSQPLLLDFSVDNTIFDVQSHYPELFRELPGTYAKVRELFVQGSVFSPARIGSLNISQEEDLLLLGELHIIQEVARTLKSRREYTQGRLPDFYHFRVRGLAELSRAYGQDSAQVKDARALLEAVLSKMTQDFKEVYRNNVMVQVVSLPAEPAHQHQRHTRSLLQDETDDASDEADSTIEQQLGYGPDWDSDFPVYFNIILWTVVVLIVSIVFISIGMWNMDPGRDSIIYRMTSQRIKKD